MIRARPKSGTAAVLDSSLLAEARVVVTPPASDCVHALDAGTTSSPLLADYTRLSPADTWHDGAAFGWVGTVPEASDSGLPDVFRRDYVRGGGPCVLRLQLPAGACTAYLLTGDPNTFTRTLIVEVDGAEKARSDELTGREFQWLAVPLDGGSAGRAVDLRLSAKSGDTWHLSACVVVAD
ncbi:hypothetical protein NKH77_55310 [Streptomyces sp. M19]